jgi:hypothetical protein
MGEVHAGAGSSKGTPLHLCGTLMVVAASTLTANNRAPTRNRWLRAEAKWPAFGVRRFPPLWVEGRLDEAKAALAAYILEIGRARQYVHLPASPECRAALCLL